MIFYHKHWMLFDMDFPLPDKEMVEDDKFSVEYFLDKLIVLSKQIDTSE